MEWFSIDFQAGRASGFPTDLFSQLSTQFSANFSTRFSV
jgi:hypothetical protein